jgi:hypothetical protein
MMPKRPSEEGYPMKRVLIAAVALAAMAGAAAAQPAYDSSQGGPPSDYPRCTHKGQDRCMSGGGHMKGHHMGGHHMSKGDKDKGDKGKGGKSSSDGERG